MPVGPCLWPLALAGERASWQRCLLANFDQPSSGLVEMNINATLSLSFTAEPFEQ